MFFTKEKNKTLVAFFLALVLSLFYYPISVNSETIVSEVTVEVHKDTSIFTQVVQSVLPKTNEHTGLFLTWIGLFLIIGFVVWVSYFKNRTNLDN